MQQNSKEGVKNSGDRRKKREGSFNWPPCGQKLQGHPEKAGGRLASTSHRQVGGVGALGLVIDRREEENKFAAI